MVSYMPKLFQGQSFIGQALFKGSEHSVKETHQSSCPVTEIQFRFSSGQQLKLLFRSKSNFPSPFTFLSIKSLSYVTCSTKSESTSFATSNYGTPFKQASRGLIFQMAICFWSQM